MRDKQNATLGTWAQGNRRPIVTKYYANKDAMFDTYAYPGRHPVLHMLRKHLGDKMFAKSLNHYLTNNAIKPSLTEDLADRDRRDVGANRWTGSLTGKTIRMGHPVFEGDASLRRSDEKLTLNVKQTQKLDLNNEYPQVAYFQSYVDVAIDNKVQRVWLEPKAENVFKLDARRRSLNSSILITEGTLLKEMTFEKSTDDLLYQMANDKDPLGRRWA